jgi:hypothetical protein
VIIHQPEISSQDDHTTLWAKIESPDRHGFFPEYLWYRLPEEYEAFFTTQNDVFLINLVLAGMYFGEDIEVRGCVSPRLAYQLEEYIYLLRFRFPQYLHGIEIKYDHLAPLDISPQGVGSTFSGGVDSLFTIWKHLTQNQPHPDYQITHGVFIHGFDLLPSEKPHFDFLFQKYCQETKNLGIELVPLETNAFSAVHQRLPPPIFYGPILIAAAAALSGLFRRFFIPSSRDYQILQRKFHASNPLMDRMLSTNTLDIINHGTDYRRVDKISEIADWELAQKILWVCEAHQFTGDTWNCSRCEKCVRTMIPIYALGKMDRFATFSQPFKSDRDGLRWARKYSLQRIYIHEILPFVKEHKPGWIPWLIIAAALGTLRYGLFVRFLPGFVKKWLRRYGYFLNRNESPRAYEVPEITRQIQRVYDHPPT